MITFIHEKTGQALHYIKLKFETSILLNGIKSKVVMLLVLYLYNNSIYLFDIQRRPFSFLGGLLPISFSTKCVLNIRRFCTINITAGT